MSTKNTNQRKTNLGVDDFAFVRDPVTGRLQPLSPELYRERQRAQQQRAATSAGIALAAEGGKFLVEQVGGDEVIKELREEKADIEARLASGPQLPTEEEEEALKTAAIEPMKQQAAQRQRDVESALASTGGQINPKALIAAGQIGVEQARQSAMEGEAAVARLRSQADQIKADQDFTDRQRLERINATLFKIRNETRGKISNIISKAAEFGIVSEQFRAQKNIDDATDELRALKVPDKDIAAVSKLFRQKKTKQAKEAAAKLVEQYGQKGTDAVAEPAEKTSPADAPATEKPAAAAAPSEDLATTWSDGYAEYTLEGENITYISPKSGKKVTVRPGTVRNPTGRVGGEINVYDAIMAKRPKAPAGDQEEVLTADQIRQQADALASEVQKDEPVQDEDVQTADEDAQPVEEDDSFDPVLAELEVVRNVRETTQFSEINPMRPQREGGFPPPKDFEGQPTFNLDFDDKNFRIVFASEPRRGDADGLQQVAIVGEGNRLLQTIPFDNIKNFEGPQNSLFGLIKTIGTRKGLL